MSEFVILPTFDLVTECETYDNLYRTFLLGGVKSLIKDAVLNTSFNTNPLPPELELSTRLKSHANPLVDHVLSTFDNYIDRQQRKLFDEEGPSIRRFDVEYYLSQVGELELITLMIDEAVTIMMEDLFRRRLYHINERETKWSGRDLIIRVETLNSRRGNHRAL